MTNSIDCSNINTHWQDDFYFCEEKIISTLTQLWGCNHDLMFYGTMNFSYTKNDGDKCIGNRIGVHYLDLTDFLNTYQGVSINKINKTNTDYSPTDIYNLCKESVSQGIPVAIGLDNSLSIWNTIPGEENINILPLLVVGINKDQSVNLINFHELGSTINISKKSFLKSYQWYASFSKEDTVKDIDLYEILDRICLIQKLDTPVTNGCDEYFSKFPNLSEQVTSYSYTNNHNWYKEMLQLADDVLDMDLRTEVQGHKSVLFVPFYFDLLVLYRSRLVFTKALTYLNNYFNFNIFDEIINKAMISSSKWNYLRMLFANSYHNNSLYTETKIVMSKLIKEIAEYEYSLNADLELLRNKYNPEQSNSTFSMIDLSDYHNHVLFNSNIPKDSDIRIIHNRYYYEGDVPFGTVYDLQDEHFTFPTLTEHGDSVVCIGQQINVEKDTYSSITFIGSALYNEMVYDYITINYTDGSKERICLGFNGWNHNEYDIDTSPKKVVWEGKVLKRKVNDESQRVRVANIYSKTINFSREGIISSISLPINSFLSIIAITLNK